MNLNELFELQRKLDEHIIIEKGLVGKDLLPEKILSLQVELGELANELPEVFKFWSNKKNDYNKALVEYCDCLHFILSIGLELNIPVIYGTKTKWDELTSDETDITQQFLLVFENVNKLVHPIDWINLFEEFYILGEMLGFTWEQVEQAYLQKNEKNHKRQEDGY